MRSMIARDEEIMDGSSRRCHIIVGGGSSGIMLCHQLLKKDDVILIERGSKNPYAPSYSTKVPSSWPVAAIYEADASRSSTMPQEALGNRVLLYPQGSGVGGTSNINAMIWSAGHQAVFNNYWPKKWNSEAINRFEHK
jgi:choline dehydrogenase